MEDRDTVLDKVVASMNVSVGYVVVSECGGGYVTSIKVNRSGEDIMALLTINPESGELDKFMTERISEALIFETAYEARRCLFAVDGRETQRVLVFKEGDSVVEVELSKTKNNNDEYLQAELKKLAEQMKRHSDVFTRLANK